MDSRDIATKALAAAGVRGPPPPVHDKAKKGKANEEMIKMQQGLKNNHEDVNNYVADLDSWYKEVSEKDKNKKVREAAF